MKELEGKITISRINTFGDGYIEISIQDNKSMVEFAEIRIKYEDFTKALTGQGMLPMTFNTRGLDVVGKVKEQKPLIFEIPKEINYMNQKDWAEKHYQEFAEEGWQGRGYYRSQTSIQKRDGKVYAHDYQYRFVES